MTTIVAWAGVDQRGVASLYIASDSRISWGQDVQWNQGRKTFASPTSAHIFGYWGDVLFPSLALSSVLDELAAGLLSRRGSAFGRIGDSIRRLWADYPQKVHRDFGIIMATRRRDRMASIFELAVMTYTAATKAWKFQVNPMPSSSAQLHVAGSGRGEVRSATNLWAVSAQGGTSRAIYSAFTEALQSGRDPLSGGGPQLVCLRRIGPGLQLGTYFQGNRYFAGARITEAAALSTHIEWFNELFERVDGRGKLLQGAQRHGRR